MAAHHPDLSRAVWRKSDRSSSEGQNCVEVATNLACVVAVRDSKDPIGPKLIFTPNVWRTFARSVKTDTDDLRSTLPCSDLLAWSFAMVGSRVEQYAKAHQDFDEGSFSISSSHLLNNRGCVRKGSRYQRTLVLKYSESAAAN